MAIDLKTIFQKVLGFADMKFGLKVFADRKSRRDRPFIYFKGKTYTYGQTGKDRPSIETPIDGLYLVGSDVGRDNIGTELAAQSALQLADMLR
jgi:hypothetical protein